MREEILIAIVMFGITLAGSFIKKNDRKWMVLFLFVASVAGSLTAGMGIRFREIVEGPFAFLDTSMSVLTAAVFVWLLYVGGSFDIIFSRITKIKNSILKAFAVLMFIAFPAALTGFTMASVLTTGMIAGKNLKENGVDSKKVTIAVTGGSFIGMVLPPNCIPAIIASNGAGSVLPTPYVGFFLPLLILAVPSFFVFAFCNKTTLSSVKETVSEKKDIFSMIVLGIVIVLILIEGLLSQFVYVGGNTLIFFIASILLVAINKGFGGFKKCIDTIADGVETSVWPIALMLAVGFFVEVSSMSGVRGLYSLWILPYKVPNVMLVMIAISLLVGFFAGEALPAFLITYAVYPISWLANTVVVTGCAAALTVIYLITRNNGLIAQVSKNLDTDTKYSDVIVSMIPIAVITVAIGLVYCYCGDNMSALIL